MNKLIKALRAHFDSLTEEEKAEIAASLKGEEIPKGWISIEEHLPGWKAVDVMQGYSEYTVKDNENNQFTSRVTDHDAWYYAAKEAGITHWLNT